MLDARERKHNGWDGLVTLPLARHPSRPFAHARALPPPHPETRILANLQRCQRHAYTHHYTTGTSETTIEALQSGTTDLWVVQ